MTTKEKIAFLFTPFIKTHFALVLIYTGLHWLISIKLGWIAPNSIFLNFILPILLSAFLVLANFTAKINVLHLPADKINHGPLAYNLAILVALGLPLLLWQNYMTDANARLITLNSPRDMPKDNTAMYYNFKTYYADRGNSVIAADVDSKGKENLELKLDVLIPLSANEADTTKTNAWLLAEFDETVAAKKEMDDELKESVTSFYMNSMAAIDTINTKFQYVKVEDMPSKYETELVESEKYQGESAWLLKPVRTPFDKINEGMFEKILMFTMSFTVIWLCMVIAPSIDSVELAKWQARHNTGGGTTGRQTPPPLPIP